MTNNSPSILSLTSPSDWIDFCKAAIQCVTRKVLQCNEPPQSPCSWDMHGSEWRRERGVVESFAAFTVEKTTISSDSALSSVMGTPVRVGTPDLVPKG